MIPLLPECRQSGQHFCELCRDRDRGRDFRATILTVRGIEHDPDFDCPRGREWGATISPAPTTDADIRQAIARADTCRPCEHAKKVTLTVNTRPVYGVKCGKCGCGNLSLISGKCPLNKWDQADAT